MLQGDEVEKRHRWHQVTSGEGMENGPVKPAEAGMVWVEAQ
jgi:hypothetical protein